LAIRGRLSLFVVRVLAGVLWVLVARASGGQALPVDQAQTTKAEKLEFEVASVRQNKSDVKQSSNFSLDSGNIYSGVNKDDVFKPEGGYFSATNMSLVRCIVFAYKLTGTQELALRFKFFTGLSSNVPEWIHTERFDIKARAEGYPTKDQMRLMMRGLLADRFKLVVHKEMREVPVFALVVANSGMTGPRLQQHPADDTCLIPPATAPAVSTAPDLVWASVELPALPAVCGVLAHLPPSAEGRLSFGARGVDLDLLANSLPTQTGMATISRPVVNQTGLVGLFDFSVEWAPEVEGGQPGPSGPTFNEALKKQLGLKLDPKKGPVELLVIDHVEQPSEN
jgi:uncharacterized protein (TIGR03435 family)